MITHFPDDIIPRERRMLKKAADDAWKWVTTQRYRNEIKRSNGSVQLCRPNVKIMHEDQSWYHPASNSVWLGIDRIGWLTYERHKLGMAACTDRITPQQLWTITLIHEYTHAIQRWRFYHRNRTTGCSRYHFSELETTRNEFMYVAKRWPRLLLAAVHPINLWKPEPPSKFMINLLVYAVKRHKTTKETVQ